MRRIIIFAAIFALIFGVIANVKADSVKVADFTLNDLDGNPVTISELGGLLVLDFWATWCPPCKVEIPYLQELYDDFKDQGLYVVGISTEDVATQRRFIEQMENEGVEMTYLLLVDPDATVTREYEIEGIPTTIFVKPDLTLIEREVGFIPQYAERFREIIENNLPQED